MNDRAPVDNLLRAWDDPAAVSLRSADTTGDVMTGHFAVFDQWTLIDSPREGTFLERIRPGSAKETLKGRGAQARVLYEHGKDPSVGNKPLGTPTRIAEEGPGVGYDVAMFDASYVNDLKPAIRSGQMGASFRFRATKEEWVDPKAPSDYNPLVLPERSVTGFELYEFGPCPFGAYAGATSGMRSLTDWYADLFSDPLFVMRFTERVGTKVAQQVLESFDSTPTATPDRQTTGQARRLRFRTALTTLTSA